MNRRELDAFAAHHGLQRDAVETALDLTDARPSRQELLGFGVRALHLAGVLSLAAGVVFFVAANWAALQVAGRFALVEGVLVVTVALALWRPPPRPLGRYALLLSFIVTGALFALFGQTYQTGADVYELFLNWSLLGLAFVLAAQWSVVWAAWIVVLDVALALFCAARPEAGLLWRLLGAWDVNLSHLLLLPLAINVALWLAGLGVAGTRSGHLAPPWLARLVLAFAVAYGTWGGMIVVVGAREGEGLAGLLVPLVVMAAVAAHTLRRREDVFPLALIEASLIVLSTAWLFEVLDFDDAGTLFIVALWLVVSSTLSSYYLMRLVRDWEPPDPEESIVPRAVGP